jgi:hypothetical protein
MPQIKLKVVEHQELYDIERFITVRVRTTEELLEKTKQLKRRFGNSCFNDWHCADVYIYDPRPEPYMKEINYKPEELFKLGSYPMVAKIVYRMQGKKLKYEPDPELRSQENGACKFVS